MGTSVLLPSSSGDSETVAFSLAFRGCQTLPSLRKLADEVVVYPHDHEVAIVGYLEGNLAQRFFPKRGRSFDGVVEGVAEQRAQFEARHEAETAGVDVGDEPDPLALAEGGLIGKDDVDRFVARLDERLVRRDALAHALHERLHLADTMA